MEAYQWETLILIYIIALNNKFQLDVKDVRNHMYLKKKKINKSFAIILWAFKQKDKIFENCKWTNSKAQKQSH